MSNLQFSGCISNGARLRSFRTLNNLSRKSLAAMLNVSVSSIQKYEADKSTIPSRIIDTMKNEYSLELIEPTKAKGSVVRVNTNSRGKYCIGKSKELGKRIREFRKSKGVSAYKLGSWIGKSEKTVYNYECGYNYIPVSVISELNKHGFGGTISTTSSKVTTKTSKSSSSINSRFTKSFSTFYNSAEESRKEFCRHHSMSGKHLSDLLSGKSTSLSVKSLHSLKNSGWDVFSI